MNQIQNEKAAVVSTCAAQLKVAEEAFKHFEAKLGRTHIAVAEYKAKVVGKFKQALNEAQAEFARVGGVEALVNKINKNDIEEEV